MKITFEDPADSSAPLVDVGTQFVHDWSSIHASWHFIDQESPIVNYQWAIGEEHWFYLHFSADLCDRLYIDNNQPE